MTFDDFNAFCQKKKGSECSFPFGPQTIVFKVGGKIFALAFLDPFTAVSLKCDPEKAIRLRQENASITTARYMSKKHWNSVVLNAHVSDKEVYELIDHSYNLVYEQLSEKIKNSL